MSPAFGQTTITAVAITSTPTGGTGANANTVYKIGDVFTVEFTYSANLGTVGSPRLGITLTGGRTGGGAKEAACTAAQTKLLCSYTIQEGDDGDGINVAANAFLVPNQLPDDDYTETRSTDDDVDGIRLAFNTDTGVSVTAPPGTQTGFKAGDRVEVTIDFANDNDLPAYRSGFGVALVLDNNAERAMSHVEDGNNATLKFSYLVAAGDNARAFKLKLTGAENLSDLSGNTGFKAGEDPNKRFTSDSRRRIDTLGPTITQVRVDTKPKTSAYDLDTEDNQTIRFVVDFNEKLGEVASNAVNLDVLIGTTTVSFPCTRGGDSTTQSQLMCTHTVAAGQLDTNGISISATPLAFGTALKDDLGNIATNRTTAKVFSDQKVDAVRPTVSSLQVTVPTAKVANNIVVRLTFSENVKVGTAPPMVAVTIEDGPGGNALFARQTSARVLEFRLPLADGDVDGHSATSGADNTRKVTLGTVTTASIEDIAGNGAADTIAATALPNHTVSDLSLQADRADKKRPTLERIELANAPESGRYPNGGTINFVILFSEPVTQVQNARLKLRIGSSDVTTLPTVGGSGARRTASYQILEGDCTRASCSIGVDGISLPTDGDHVKDPAGHGWENDSGDNGTGGESDDLVTETALISRSLSGSASVDTVAPKIASVKFLTNPGPTALGEDGRRYYGLNAKIWIEITMSEDVKVTTIPTGGWKIPLTVANHDGAMATYLVDRSTSKKLLFQYTVVKDAKDINGIRVNELTGDGDATVKDLAGNDATFTNAAVDSAIHRVDGSIGGDAQVLPPVGGEEPAPSVNPVQAASVPVPSDGYYTSGETFTIRVPLSPTVTFTSKPQLLLNFDNGGGRRLDAEGTFSSNGSPKTSLSFSYRVVDGDEDLDGFTGTITGGGTLTVESGQRVNLGGITVSSSVKIDARAPSLQSLRITSDAGSDGTYVTGDEIEVTATFSEDVQRASVGAEPTVPITVGTATRTATLQTPSSTGSDDAYVFRYTVAAGDSDSDGVSIGANALVASLEDGAGNAASITHAAVAANADHKVDTQGPSVTGVAISGDENGLFVEGKTITATVTFDEEVDVTTSGSGAVTVKFNIGTSERMGTYRSGDGENTLTFTYVVVLGDTGPISVPANAIVGDVTDAAGNPAGPTPAVPITPYRVDASAPMLVGAPTITSNPANGDTYVQGETIAWQVEFDEVVIVTGEPRLPMMVGERLRSRVLYNNGSGTDTLAFTYTVQSGDLDDNGVSLEANSLRLTSGATIKDVNGLSVASEDGRIVHAAVPDQSGHKVDAVAPGVESLAITSSPASGDAYLIEETIEVTVTFSEGIATEGSPTLGIMVGTGNRDANCAQGGARNALMCSYTVVANDFDANGVSVNADSLTGTIMDMPGNAADLTHDALADDPAHKVYAAAPEAVRGIAPLSMAAGGATNSLDLGGIFTGFQLEYSASSSDENVVMASVSGSDLTVRSGMEGTATVTVTATNLAGSANVMFEVRVATDPVETAVLNDALAAIGRSMLSSTANVIGSRFELAATGAQMSLGGSRFGGSMSADMQRLMAGGDPFAMQARMEERALFDGSAGMAGFDGGYGLTADRLLSGTSFNMPLNALGTGGMTSFAIWGAGDLASFEGEPDNGMYDGSSSAGFIGVDARGDGWLAGVSVSRSGAEADYDFDNVAQTGVAGGGTLETAVTAFHPYARLEVGPDSEVWVIGGFGGGEADLSRTHVAGAQSSDLSMAMAVGGLRRALAMEFGGADLSLRGDAGFLSLETDSGMQAIDGLSASVSRLRLGLEAAWDIETMTPFVEVSGRFDGGDGQTGGGLELAGGIRILNAESGFGLEAKGRVLAMHTGDGYSESGIGVTASFEPGGGTGITFRLSPRWGGSADSTDLFWDEVGTVNDPSRYAYGLDRPQTWGMDAALGYGFGLRSVPGLVTPFTQLDVTGNQDQRIRVGVRYGLMQNLLGGTQVEVSAERVDGEMYRAAETRMLVTGRARF